MAYILAIESATKVCSAAIFDNESLLCIKEINGDYSHAENLAFFVKELIEESNLEFDQLSGIAVSKGPGSYTGLRIGVSFAKGLCYSLQIPLIAVDTLKAMAWGATQLLDKENCLLCPMIDARRMEVYTSVFNRTLNVLDPIAALVVNDQSFSEHLSAQTVYFFGDGAEKCRSVLVGENVKFLDHFSPSAANMGSLAIEKYRTESFEDVAYFEPYYLKEFIALKGKKLV